MRVFLALFVLLVLCAAPLCAKEAAPVKLGSFNGWQAFEVKSGGQQMCYMILRPNKQDYKIPSVAAVKVKGKNTKKPAGEEKQCQRSDIYLMVTFRPSESMNPVISYRSGYIFKQGSEVLLKTGPKPFNLFTDKDQAWARSGAMDVAITGALRKAKGAIIEGGSNMGGKSTDSFNLDGAESAYKAIVKACGIT